MLFSCCFDARREVGTVCSTRRESQLLAGGGAGAGGGCRAIRNQREWGSLLPPSSPIPVVLSSLEKTRTQPVEKARGMRRASLSKSHALIRPQHERADVGSQWIGTDQPPVFGPGVRPPLAYSVPQPRFQRYRASRGEPASVFPVRPQCSLPIPLGDNAVSLPQPSGDSRPSRQKHRDSFLSERCRTLTCRHRPS